MILLVDIGGTSINLYQFNELNRSHRKINTIDSKGIYFNDWINKLIKKPEINFYEYILIGIPGDVVNSKNDVYCPPLNCFISKFFFNKKNVFIVNDMFIQGFLAISRKQIKSKHTLIVNVGTSIGVLLVDEKFQQDFSLKYLTSYEFAHLPLNKNGSVPLLYKSISKFIGKKVQTFCSVYSAGGFAAANFLPVNSDEFPIIRVSKQVLGYAINNENLDKKTCEEWFKSLLKDLKLFAWIKINNVSNLKIIIRGGLYEALKESNYAYLYSEHLSKK